MSKTLEQVILTYINNPKKRLKYIISNNYTFIDQLKCLKQKKVNLKIALKFMQLLVQEELRRHKIPITPFSDTEDYLPVLFDIDIDNLSEYYFNKLKERYPEKLNDNKFLEEKLFNDDFIDYKYNYKKLSDEAKRVFTIYKKALYEIGLPLIKKCSFITKKKIDYSSLSKLGICKNEHLYSLILQNLINEKDYIMMKSILEDEYMDYIDESNEYLDKLIHDLIFFNVYSLINDNNI
jgi:hypothetical protein